MTSPNITRLNLGKQNLHWCTLGAAVSRQLIKTCVCANLSNKYTVGAQIPNIRIPNPFENRTFLCSVLECSVFEFIYKTTQLRAAIQKVPFSNGWDQNRTTMEHLNSERDRNSSPHCTSQYCMYITISCLIQSTATYNTVEQILVFFPKGLKKVQKNCAKIYFVKVQKNVERRTRTILKKF